MKMIRPYIIIAIVLLLTAGPWLQLVQATPTSSATECNCCEGACEGCCCSQPEPLEVPDCSLPKTGCQCDMGSLPAFPDLHLEFHESRNQKDQTDTAVMAREAATPITTTASTPVATSNSPPAKSRPPAYVLFEAFLS